MHTPGPWKITGDHAHPSNLRVWSEVNRHIALVYACDISRDLVCEANARLMAAAPDLLAALERVEKTFTQGTGGTLSETQLEHQVRAAIARATETQ